MAGKKQLKKDFKKIIKLLGRMIDHFDDKIIKEDRLVSSVCVQNKKKKKKKK